MYSFIYVSRRTNCPDETILEVDDILKVSRIRNAALGVTGALIATPQHFAQILEGSQEALAQLIASIRDDRRHSIVHYLDLPQKGWRDFEGWSLAYHGDSLYVGTMLADAAVAPELDISVQVNRIRSLMLMFA